MSRSALADRFMHFVGQPPLHYLAQWRMQVAAGLLTSGGASIAAVATDVGYGSEAAFSRAFKKLVGTPPAAWRRRQGTSAQGAAAECVRKPPPSSAHGGAPPPHRWRPGGAISSNAALSR